MESDIFNGKSRFVVDRHTDKFTNYCIYSFIVNECFKINELMGNYLVVDT